jgi:hypothetical protein
MSSKIVLMARSSWLISSLSSSQRRATEAIASFAAPTAWQVWRRGTSMQ